MSIEFKCPSCGKKLFTYEYRIRKYGCPVKECKKCGCEYIDPRYYELAIDGVPEDEYKILPYVLMIVIGLLIMWRGYHMLGMRQLGVSAQIQWLLPCVFLIFGIVLVIGAVGGIIMIVTGLHRKKIERLLEESEDRVRDYSYVKKLQRLGYKIPDGRFGGLEQ